MVATICISDAQSIAERLRAKTEETKIESNDSCINYTTSIGLQFIENYHSSHFDRWINAADALLYRAKMEGRNRVVWSDSLQS